MLVERCCPWCGKLASVEVPTPAFRRWQSGVPVQSAFPTLTPDQREVLVSGTHPACWAKLFPDDDPHADDLIDARRDARLDAKRGDK